MLVKYRSIAISMKVCKHNYVILPLKTELHKTAYKPVYDSV